MAYRQSSNNMGEVYCGQKKTLWLSVAGGKTIYNDYTNMLEENGKCRKKETARHERKVDNEL
jgi:hypothetical protein